MSIAKETVRSCACIIVVVLFNHCNFEPQKVQPKRYIVEIKQMQFQPSTLKLNRGDTVEWVNHDFVTHDITEESHKAWNSSLLSANASWYIIVKRSADYYCSIHQVMKGKLVVDK